jgi:hypothetical protein
MELEKSKKEQLAWLGPEHPFCPKDCCTNEDFQCRQQMGGYGHTIKLDEEIMIIFGGITARQKYWSDGILDYSLYN